MLNENIAKGNYRLVENPTHLWATRIVGWTIVAAALLCLIAGVARAEEVNISKLADAIYLAEGGVKTSHPYGILAHYKHTTPRQACVNTIKHALKDWNGRGEFIVFLGSRYCPPAAHPLNKNWVKNVRYFYERGI